MVYRVISHGINHPSHNYEDTIKSGAICPECGEFNTDMLVCRFQHNSKKGLIYTRKYVTGRFLCKTCECIFESKRICVDKERSKLNDSFECTMLLVILRAILCMVAIVGGMYMIGYSCTDDGIKLVGIAGFIIMIVGIIRFLCIGYDAGKEG